MTKINFNKIPSKDEFDRLSSVYESNRNVSIDLEHFNNTSQISDLIIFLLKQQPTDFTLAILANLVEHDDFPEEFLGDVFALNDTACQVSICLRKSLPKNIESLCMTSINEDVVSHFKGKSSGK